jgi:hypothetical protein
MMIFMLAAAMTITMLIATVFGLHQEAERFRFEHKKDRQTPFGPN